MILSGLGWFWDTSKALPAPRMSRFTTCRSAGSAWTSAGCARNRRKGYSCGMCLMSGSWAVAFTVVRAWFRFFDFKSKLGRHDFAGTILQAHRHFVLLCLVCRRCVAASLMRRQSVPREDSDFIIALIEESGPRSLALNGLAQDTTWTSRASWSGKSSHAWSGARGGRSTSSGVALPPLFTEENHRLSCVPAHSMVSPWLKSSI